MSQSHQNGCSKCFPCSPACGHRPAFSHALTAAEQKITSACRHGWRKNFVFTSSAFHFPRMSHLDRFWLSKSISWRSSFRSCGTSTCFQGTSSNEDEKCLPLGPPCPSQICVSRVTISRDLHTQQKSCQCKSSMGQLITTVGWCFEKGVAVKHQEGLYLSQAPQVWSTRLVHPANHRSSKKWGHGLQCKFSNPNEKKVHSGPLHKDFLWM